MNDEHHEHHDRPPLAEPGYAEAAQPGPSHGHNAHADHGDHGGYDKHAGHSVEMLRNKFWISLALTIPMVVWGQTRVARCWRTYGYQSFVCLEAA